MRAAVPHRPAAERRRRRRRHRRVHDGYYPFATAAAAQSTAWRSRGGDRCSGTPRRGTRPRQHAAASTGWGRSRVLAADGGKKRRKRKEVRRGCWLGGRVRRRPCRKRATSRRVVVAGGVGGGCPRGCFVGRGRGSWRAKAECSSNRTRRRRCCCYCRRRRGW